jgi:hypothetical protein
MKYTIATLLAATLAAAAPVTNQTTTLERRDFQGSIQFFDRYDCQNKCVEDGYCLAGQVDEGMEGSDSNFIGYDSETLPLSQTFANSYLCTGGRVAVGIAPTMQTRCP